MGTNKSFFFSFFSCRSSTTFCIGYSEKNVEFNSLLLFFAGTSSSSPPFCGSRLPALRVWLGRAWSLRRAYLKYASLDSVLGAVSLRYQTCQVQELAFRRTRLRVHCQRQLPTFFMICSFILGSFVLFCFVFFFSFVVVVSLFFCCFVFFFLQDTKRPWLV